MVYKKWIEYDSAIEHVIGAVTSMQLKLAKFAKIVLPNDIPANVAGALLRTALSDYLISDTEHKPSSRILSCIDDHWDENEKKPNPISQEEARAWMDYHYLKKRRVFLKNIKPNEGDILLYRNKDFVEVASIGNNGRIFFKGGNGFGAWPDMVELKFRCTDKSNEANQARAEARNYVSSLRKPIKGWSISRDEDLDEFKIDEQLNTYDIDDFEEVINSSQDERPIQKFIEQKPQILTALLGGRNRFVIPQKRLGSEFVSDFIIGDTDSLGVHWLLVELESPNVPMFLTDGKTLSAQARKGVNQILEWRIWLGDNIAYARNPRRANGLGLYDIREKTRAIVVVGNRLNLNEKNQAVRQNYRQDSNIEIHTYDWLVEWLRGANEFNGPPACNKYLLRFDE